MKTLQLAFCVILYIPCVICSFIYACMKPGLETGKQIADELGQGIILMSKILEKLGWVDYCPKTLLTIDVGFHTGICLTVNGKIEDTGLIVEHVKNKKQPIGERILDMSQRLMAQIVDYGVIDLCIIEGVQIYASSEKSMVAASAGDAIGLAYLAGSYSTLLGFHGIQSAIINPRDWKGSMNKDIVERRILRALNQKFKDHVEDAVGMSLAIRGKLQWLNLAYLNA